LVAAKAATYQTAKSKKQPGATLSSHQLVELQGKVSSKNLLHDLGKAKSCITVKNK